MRLTGLLLLILVLPLKAQKILYTDSVLHYLDTTTSPISRIEANLALSKFHLSGNYREVEKYANKASELSRQISYTKGEGEALRILGTNEWLHAYYKSALIHLKSSVERLKASEANEELAMAYNTIGLVFLYQSYYDSSAIYLRQSLNLFEVLKDSTNMGRVNNNLGIVFENKGDFLNAMEYFVGGLRYSISVSSLHDQSESISSQIILNENELIVKALQPKLWNESVTLAARGDFYNLARKQSELGVLYLLTSHTDSAYHYLTESKNLFSKLGMETFVLMQERFLAGLLCTTEGVSVGGPALEALISKFVEYRMMSTANGILEDLAKLYREAGNMDLAIKFLIEGIEMTDTLNHVASNLEFKRELANIYTEQGRRDLAYPILTESYKKAREIGAVKQISRLAQQLSLYFKREGDYEKSLSFLEEYESISELLNNTSKNKEYARMQATYEAELRNAEISNLGQSIKKNQVLVNRQRTYITIISFSVITLVGLVIALVGRIRKVNLLGGDLSRQNKSLKDKVSENQVLMNEIHHRVKNNLQMISSLLSIQNRRSENPESKELLLYTKNRVMAIGLIHEHLYQTEDISHIDLKLYFEDLVEMLLVNMTREKFPELEIKCESQLLDIDRAIIIGLLLNELITNSLKYAFSDTETPFLKISCRKVNSNLILTVCDNGPGFDPETQQGFGWSIIQSMLTNLNGSVVVKRESRFEVILTIPFK